MCSTPLRILLLHQYHDGVNLCGIFLLALSLAHSLLTPHFYVRCRSSLYAFKIPTTENFSRLIRYFVCLSLSLPLILRT